MPAKPKAKTGSAKLTAAGRGFPAARLRALVELLKKNKLDKDIIINGKPLPDFLKGRFTTADSAAVLAILRGVIGLGGTHKVPIKIFPNGQPPAIDQFNVEIPGVRAR